MSHVSETAWEERSSDPESVPPWCTGAFLNLCHDLKAGDGGWREDGWQHRIHWVRLEVRVYSFSRCSFCSLPLPTSLLFLFLLFFLLYVNADRRVQDTQWYLWIMLSPICVMELKGCCLCLEYDMLSRAIWIHCRWLGAQQGASDYPFVFLGTKQQRVNFFKRNWSSVANHVLLPRLPFLLQLALSFTDCHTHLIRCSMYILEGSPVWITTSLPVKGHCKPWLLP